MKKALFLRQKSEWKIEHFERLARPPANIVSRYGDSIYPSTFHAKKGPIPALIKKSTVCVTREQLTFSDSDDDFELSCRYHSGAGGALVNHSCTIIILTRRSQHSSLVTQCTIVHQCGNVLYFAHSFRFAKSNSAQIGKKSSIHNTCAIGHHPLSSLLSTSHALGRQTRLVRE